MIIEKINPKTKLSVGEMLQMHGNDLFFKKPKVPYKLIYEKDLSEFLWIVRRFHLRFLVQLKYKSNLIGLFV